MTLKTDGEKMQEALDNLKEQFYLEYGKYFQPIIKFLSRFCR